MVGARVGSVISGRRAMAESGDGPCNECFRVSAGVRAARFTPKQLKLMFPYEPCRYCSHMWLLYMWLLWPEQASRSKSEAGSSPEAPPVSPASAPQAQLSRVSQAFGFGFRDVSGFVEG